MQPKGSTWRNRRETGGGCLYDYAAHTIDLVNWYLGPPESASGTVFGHIFSENTEDEVYSTLTFSGDRSAQLSVNWSDESYRKMTTKLTVWGPMGRISVNRQECQTYLREGAVIPPGYTRGWNVRYTTDLTDPVWFYLRGEEYSAELDQFVRHASDIHSATEEEHLNGFRSAAATDRVIDMLIADNSSVSNGSVVKETTGNTEPQGKLQSLRKRIPIFNSARKTLGI
ncbi:Gfo/Idh/MocA family protein [Arthrobacter psychrolactophilus]